MYTVSLNHVQVQFISLISLRKNSRRAIVLPSYCQVIVVLKHGLLFTVCENAWHCLSTS
jgi:hypothetical protein